MRIGILSRSAKIYSTARLVEAAEGLGHEVTVINPLKCHMNITSAKPDVYYKDHSEQRRLDFDAVIPRIGASVTKYGTAVLRQFEVDEVYTLNSSVAITRSRDKLRAHQVLARKHIGIPITSCAHSGEAVEDLISSVGGAPLIVKITENTQGKGVLLAKTTKEAEGLIGAFISLHADFLVQEFIKEAGGADVRCFVVGDKVVAAMKRQGPEGDFRSNLHNGGSAMEIKIRPEERAMAVSAAKVLGLKVAGVDLIRAARGPLVLEVNSSPGIEGIEKATGKDIAKTIIEFIEKDINKTSRSMSSIQGG